jgi:hypothetical protein
LCFRVKFILPNTKAVEFSQFNSYSRGKKRNQNKSTRAKKALSLG